MRDKEFEQKIKDIINYHLIQHRLTHGAYQWIFVFGEVRFISLN